MNPKEEAIAIVRKRLHDVRVWLGETSDEHETYPAKHAKEQTR